MAGARVGKGVGSGTHSPPRPAWGDELVTPSSRALAAPATRRHAAPRSGNTCNRSARSAQPPLTCATAAFRATRLAPPRAVPAHFAVPAASLQLARCLSRCDPVVRPVERPAATMRRQCASAPGEKAHRLGGRDDLPLAASNESRGLPTLQAERRPTLESLSRAPRWTVSSRRSGAFGALGLPVSCSS